MIAPASEIAYVSGVGSISVLSAISRRTGFGSPDHRRVIVYAIASGLAAILALGLTRLLWRTLTREDFGLWSLIDPILLPAASLILFGVENAIVKQLRVDRLTLREVTGILLASTLPVTVVSLLIITVVARQVFHLAWANALVLTLAGEALLLMIQTAYRAAGLVNGFAILLLSSNVLYIVLLAVAWFYKRQDTLPIKLVFYTRGVCVIFVSLLALARLRPVLRIDHRRYLDAFRYGAPLLLASFVFAVNDSTDRWFLVDYSGVAAVGIYALHLKLGAILVQAIVIPFGLWYPTERFKRLNTGGDGDAFFINTASALSIICTYLSGVVWLSRDLLLSCIAPGAEASPVILGCCLASVISLALSQALNVGLLLPGQTFKNAICSLCAVVGTAFGASVLIRVAGVDGAAMSRLLGAVVMTSMTAALSQRVCRVAFPFGTMVLYFGASGLGLVGIDYVVAGGFSQDLAGISMGPEGVAVAIACWTMVTAVFGVLFLSRLPGLKHWLRPRLSSRTENEAV